MPRVLHVVQSGDRGGVQRHVADLILGLPQLTGGLVVGSSGLLSEAVATSGIPVHYAPHLRRSSDPLSVAKAREEVRKVVREQNPTIVHAHGIFALLAAMPLRRGGTALAYTPHGFQWHDGSHPWPIRAVAKAVHIIARRHVTALIALVPAEATEAHQLGFTNVRCIPNGVPSNRGCHHLPNRTPIIGIATRLIKGKGLDRFIDVIARVPGVEGWIAGHGPMQEQLVALARAKGVDKRIRFMNWVDNMEEFYRDIDIYLSLSNKEGLPYAPLDACANAIPLILSNIQGHREIVQDGCTGFLVDGGSAAIAAERVQCLVVNNEKRRQMGNNAIRDVEERFALSRMLASYDGVYRELG